jgi:hypothetical protein
MKESICTWVIPWETYSLNSDYSLHRHLCTKLTVFMILQCATVLASSLSKVSISGIFHHRVRCHSQIDCDENRRILRGCVRFKFVEFDHDRLQSWGIGSSQSSGFTITSVVVFDTAPPYRACCDGSQHIIYARVNQWNSQTHHVISWWCSTVHAHKITKAAEWWASDNCNNFSITFAADILFWRSVECWSRNKNTYCSLPQ